jgi:hypothetical protein
MDAIKAFPSLLTPRGIALDMSRLAPTKPQSQTTGFKTKKAADQKKQKKLTEVKKQKPCLNLSKVA